jgi:UDP-3-O-[3-hydroxymyristoyl] N-acetylglucosamine deacetylase
MDGLPQPKVPDVTAWCQQSLKAPIGCVGVGLHSGQRVRLTFRPAPADHGIVFRRTDLGADIPARFDRVVDTRLSTVLEQGDARIGTVEHVMAALAGCGIDNALVEVDGPEPPILDGSAAPFVFLLDCAGTVAQDAPRPTIEIRRPVRVSDGEAFAELRPGTTGLDMALSIDFAAAAIGRQALSLRLTPESFRRELARARTFTLAEEIEELRASGLAQGGSLENAVVVDQARVLNPAGLRAPDEFVRHKLLDAVGDLALAGAPLCGRFIAHRSGHTLNNRLLHALLADRSAWQEIAPAQLSIAAE